MSSTSQPTVVLKDLCSIISDKDLQILLSQKDIASSIAEDLLSQLSGDSQETDQKKAVADSSSLNKVEANFESDALSNSSAFQPLQKTSAISNDIKSLSTKEKVVVDTSKESSAKNRSDRFCPPSLSINMSSSQLLTACKGLGKNGVSNTSIMAELCPPPSPPDPPYPPLSKDYLLPQAPSVFVSIYYLLNN